MFGNIGGWEILIIIFLILIFFGAKKIPELAQGLGKGIKEFRKAAKDIQEDISLEDKQIEDKEKEKQKS